MNEWPAQHYYPLEDEPAADPGPGHHSLPRGAPRHAASTHPPWPGAGDRDQDLASSPPGSRPGPLEYDADPEVPALGPWSPPAADLPRRRPQRQVPSSRGRYSRRRRFPRWLPLAGGAAVLITVIAVLTMHPATSGAQLTGRGTAASQSPRGGTAGVGPQPVISKTAAQQVLARFAQVNNQANKLRSNTLLGTAEAGSSYLLDAGTYRLEQATDPGNNQYFPLGLRDAVYYIPRQPAGDWPHFFAVKIRYVDLNSPPHVTGTGYLLFAQASARAPWRDMIEPYLIPAVTPAPAIATDAQGYAQPVSITGSASGLSAAPGQIQPDTISWLDREAAAGADPADTGNLADLHDVSYWRCRLPSGTVTDTHSAGPGPAFGLRTDGGGALFFYSLTARLRLLPPPGDTFRVTIPGYYSPSQVLQSATVGYIEQFAAFDPARGKGGPRAVAAASSIAERG